jgi:FlaA1/EpsC-like NDP-sugar epimerase
MRNRYVLGADIPLIAAAAFGAFVLRFDWFAWHYRAELVPFVLLTVLVKVPVFYFFGMYQRYWAFASVKDMVALAVTVSGASVAVAMCLSLALLSGRIAEFSRSVLLIDWTLTLLATGALRMSVRIARDSRMASRSPAPTGASRAILVVGAGEAGAIVVREMQKNPHLGMVPMGFLDDDRTKVGKRIYGLPVFGPLASLSEIVRREDADEVLIAMPKAPGSVVRAIAQDCQKLNIQSRTVPGVFELLDRQISISRLRHVDIADLLRRRVVVGADGNSAYLAGRTVAVTGAGGSIGLELCRQVAHAGPDLLVLLGHGENSIYEAQAQLTAAFPLVRILPVICDVRDADRLTHVFERLRPSVVFHAAAHKHVPLMEENPEEAVSNNVIGTRNVVDAALHAGTQRLVLISTDKAVSPTSIMGASKRVAEDIVRSAAMTHGRAFVVVRFGNVLGSRGSVVPLFKQQIERGGPLSVTHPDMKRFFMTIPEAVALVLHAGGLGRRGELFVLNMGKPVRIVDLAHDLITLSGFSPSDVPIVFTGLRPGEKLEESLWEDDAVVSETSHPDVLQVLEPSNAGGDLLATVTALEAAARSSDRLQLESALVQWIPTFAPMPDRRSFAPVHPAH